MVKNRPRGILTDNDRQYLRMDDRERKEEYSRPNLSQRWDSIEERIRHGIEDIPLVYHELPAGRRESVFRPIVEAMFPWAPVNLLADSFGFQLLGFMEQTNHEFDDEEYYEEVFEASIRQVLRAVSVGAAEIDVEVTISGWAPYDDLGEHEKLSDLEPEILHSMLNAGEISREEFSQAILAQTEGE